MKRPIIYRRKNLNIKLRNKPEFIIRAFAFLTLISLPIWVPLIILQSLLIDLIWAAIVAIYEVTEEFITSFIVALIRLPKEIKLVFFVLIGKIC